MKHYETLTLAGLLLLAFNANATVDKNETNKCKAEEKHCTFNIYPKIGFQLSSDYSDLGLSQSSKSVTPSPSTQGKYRTIAALEVTKDVTKKWELGLGIAYFDSGKADRSEVQDSITKARPNPMPTIPIVMTTKENHTLKLELPHYRSVPVYLTVKYNFKPNTLETRKEVRPFVQASLGYSFNKIKDAKTSLYSIIKTTATITDQNIANMLGPVVQQIAKSLSGIAEGNGELNLKVTNGAYLSLGTGFEWKNVSLGLSYHKFYSNLKVTDKGKTYKQKYNNDVFLLNLGYRFRF